MAMYAKIRRMHFREHRSISEIHALTVEATAWQDATVLVDKLNRTLRGWANYFQVGTVNKAYRAIDSYTIARLSRWLRNTTSTRSDVAGTGTILPRISTRPWVSYVYRAWGTTCRG